MGNERPPLSRPSERNENLDLEIIRNLSAILPQWNPFAHIYCHVYKILSNHECFSIDSEDISNNDDSAESDSSCINISPSKRIRLIEGGDRRTHALPTMEESATVILIEYSDRSFRDIVLTLRDNKRNDSLGQACDFVQHLQLTHVAFMCINHILLFLHGTYGRH